MCWEDGAVPLPPDPVTPGLLDLLTVGRLGEPAVDGSDAAGTMGGGQVDARNARSGRVSAASPWVEVEA